MTACCTHFILTVVLNVKLLVFEIAFLIDIINPNASFEQLRQPNLPNGLHFDPKLVIKKLILLRFAFLGFALMRLILITCLLITHGANNHIGGAFQHGPLRNYPIPHTNIAGLLR
jgi:hypothetical protein